MPPSRVLSGAVLFERWIGSCLSLYRLPTLERSQYAQIAFPVAIVVVDDDRGRESRLVVLVDAFNTERTCN
uniref:Uncharacterized protein n=1 Tax=Solanum lycopersicum TaxID=4081 RepID=A0A494G903_SOLLC